MRLANSIAVPLLAVLTALSAFFKLVTHLREGELFFREIGGQLFQFALSDALLRDLFL